MYLHTHTHTHIYIYIYIIYVCVCVYVLANPWRTPFLFSSFTQSQCNACMDDSACVFAPLNGGCVSIYSYQESYGCPRQRLSPQIALFSREGDKVRFGLYLYIYIYVYICSGCIDIDMVHSYQESYGCPRQRLSPFNPIYIYTYIYTYIHIYVNVYIYIGLTRYMDVYIQIWSTLTKKATAVRDSVCRRRSRSSHEGEKVQWMYRYSYGLLVPGNLRLSAQGG